MSAPRIVFAGTPDFARTILQALLDSTQCRIAAVYTQPDRPAGRGKQLQPSAVKQLAVSRDIAVHQPPTLRDAQALQQLRELSPDLMIVAAYGLILPAAVLSVPRLGCVNVHASLLPRWRGAAPIERAIEAGDHETGITIMQMDEGLDTGDILLARHCAISPAETGNSLRERLGRLGGETLLDALPALFDGRLPGLPQDDSAACYAPKLRREEAEIDWSLEAGQIEQRVRAFNSANVCQTRVNQQVLRIWEARTEEATASNAAPGTILRTERTGIYVACGKGVLILTRMQLAGGKPMDAAAMLNGRAELLRIGSRLGTT